MLHFQKAKPHKSQVNLAEAGALFSTHISGKKSGKQVQQVLPKEFSLAPYSFDPLQRLKQERL